MATYNFGSVYNTRSKQLRILSFEVTVFIHKAKVMNKIANNTAPIRGNDSYLNNSHLN